MTPSPNLRFALREMIAETIPAGGSDSDTGFLDPQLDVALTNNVTLPGAAAAVWLIKAGRALGTNGGLEKAVVGQEAFTFVSTDALYKHAMAMYAYYHELDLALINGENISTLLESVQPDVLYTGQAGTYPIG